MEKKLNKTIEKYIITFKEDIKKKIISLNFEEKSKVNELVQMVYDYNRLTITKDDLTKRKREKPVIPNINRCIANRANGEQCTRRKQMGFQFCGTHTKGTPHGIIEQNNNTIQQINQKIEVNAEEIKGIVYYIDTFNNVYKTDDILTNKANPAVIAKYVKKEDGTFTIPEFGLV
jgi:hypothetical protein